MILWPREAGRVEPLHVAAAGIWRRIEHLRCWVKAHAASGVRGRRHRPVGSALVRIDPPVSGPYRYGRRDAMAGKN